jgi:hypothetical protein
MEINAMRTCFYNSLAICFLAALLFSGCFKPETPILEPESERVYINDSTLGPAQIFYSLAQRKVVKKNSIYDWDLAFDCREDGFYIKLNSSKGMGAYNTGNRNFDLDYKKNYYPFKYDGQEGDLSKTAIGNWGDFSFSSPQSFGYVYIINRGLFEQSRKIGIKKMILKGFKEGFYNLLFADADGANQFFVRVPKSTHSNFTYFTFEEGGKIVQVEPPIDSWDLLFTPFIDSISHLKYIFKIDELNAVYDGVLFNSASRMISEDNERSFEEINFRYLETYPFTSQENYIGKRFWYWDEIYNKQAVYKGTTYILKDKYEKFYKFKFQAFDRTDFGHLKVCLDLQNL